MQALLRLTVDLVALQIPGEWKLCPPTISKPSTSLSLSPSIADTERKGKNINRTLGV